MKMRRKPIVIMFFSAMIMGLFFQNGSKVNWDEALLKRVDLKTRNSHARELLGKAYTQSAARLHEKNANLSRFILQRVKERLPQEYQKQAAALTRTIIDEAHDHGLDPVFVLAIIETESSFNPLARGGVGEIGLMQIRPETAEWIAKKRGLPWLGAITLQNPVINVQIGVTYVSWLRSQMGPNSVKYVSAYNMGPRNVRRLIAQNVKPKTYRSKVLAHYENVYKALTERSSTKTAQL